MAEKSIQVAEKDYQIPGTTIQFCKASDVSNETERLFQKWLKMNGKSVRVQKPNGVGQTLICSNAKKCLAHTKPQMSSSHNRIFTPATAKLFISRKDAKKCMGFCTCQSRHSQSLLMNKSDEPVKSILTTKIKMKHSKLDPNASKQHMESTNSDYNRQNEFCFKHGIPISQALKEYRETHMYSNWRLMTTNKRLLMAQTASERQALSYLDLQETYKHSVLTISPSIESLKQASQLDPTIGMWFKNNKKSLNKRQCNFRNRVHPSMVKLSSEMHLGTSPSHVSYSGKQVRNMSECKIESKRIPDHNNNIYTERQESTLAENNTHNQERIINNVTNSEPGKITYTGNTKPICKVLGKFSPLKAFLKLSYQVRIPIARHKIIKNHSILKPRRLRSPRKIATVRRAVSSCQSRDINTCWPMQHQNDCPNNQQTKMSGNPKQGVLKCMTSVKNDKLIENSKGYATKGRGSLKDSDNTSGDVGQTDIPHDNDNREETKLSKNIESMKEPRQEKPTTNTKKECKIGKKKLKETQKVAHSEVPIKDSSFSDTFRCHTQSHTEHEGNALKETYKLWPETIQYNVNVTDSLTTNLTDESWLTLEEEIWKDDIKVASEVSLVTSQSKNINLKTNLDKQHNSVDTHVQKKSSVNRRPEHKTSRNVLEPNRKKVPYTYSNKETGLREKYVTRAYKPSSVHALRYKTNASTFFDRFKKYLHTHLPNNGEIREFNLYGAHSIRKPKTDVHFNSETNTPANKRKSVTAPRRDTSISESKPSKSLNGAITNKRDIGVSKSSTNITRKKVNKHTNNTFHTNENERISKVHAATNAIVDIVSRKVREEKNLFLSQVAGIKSVTQEFVNKFHLTPRPTAINRIKINVKLLNEKNELLPTINKDSTYERIKRREAFGENRDSKSINMSLINNDQKSGNEIEEFYRIKLPRVYSNLSANVSNSFSENLHQNNKEKPITSSKSRICNDSAVFNKTNNNEGESGRQNLTTLSTFKMGFQAKKELNLKECHYETASHVLKNKMTFVNEVIKVEYNSKELPEKLHKMRAENRNVIYLKPTKAYKYECECSTPNFNVTDPKFLSIKTLRSALP